jgi:hypothetical protein
MRYLVSRPNTAEIFNLTKPKLAVYSHIGNFPRYDSSIDYIARTRENYSGRVIVGEDLMTITIADDVTVKAPNHAGE